MAAVSATPYLDIYTVTKHAVLAPEDENLTPVKPIPDPHRTVIGPGYDAVADRIGVGVPDDILVSA